MLKIDKPKKPVSHCHYSNSISQGTIIAETFDYPTEVESFKGHYSVYSDRLDMDINKEVSVFLGVNDQAWHDKLRDYSIISAFSNYYEVRFTPNSSVDVLDSYIIQQDETRDVRLKELAKIIFKLDVLPKHVRVIYWFDVSTGYSCPSFQCII